MADRSVATLDPEALMAASNATFAILAKYGEAMWAAQGFELTLVNTVVALAGEKGKFQIPGSFEWYVWEKDKGKLGSLVEELRRLGMPLPAGKRRRLVEGIRKEFPSASVFHQERAHVPVPYPVAANRLLRHLHTLKDAIDRADAVIRPLCVELGERLGSPTLVDAAKAVLSRVTADVAAYRRE